MNPPLPPITSGFPFAALLILSLQRADFVMKFDKQDTYAIRHRSIV